MSTNPQDPSPEEIAQRCAEIQAGWTAAEHMKRLRCDLRPSHMLADGRMRTMDADDYAGHHATRGDSAGDGRHLRPYGIVDPF